MRMRGGWFERGEREWIMIQPTLVATTLLESIADEKIERERGREGGWEGERKEGRDKNREKRETHREKDKWTREGS